MNKQNNQKDIVTEEIMQIFKRENMTAKTAWEILNTVRSQVHDEAFNNVLVKDEELK